MADREIRAQDAWVEGSVDWDGEIRLRIISSRQLRNGRYVEEMTHVSIDVDQAACVRRTLRRLAEEALNNKEKLLARETQRLEES